MRICLGAWLWCTVALHVPAQELHLTMRGPEPPLVAPGATATMELDVLGATEAEFVGALPAIDGLALAATKATPLVQGGGCRVQIALTPQRTGTFALPPFAVTARGQTLTSRGASLECATGISGAELAFLEVDAPRGPIYLGAPFVLTLRIGIERTALARQLIQLFPTRLDVPVQVQAPWLADLVGSAQGKALANLPGTQEASLVLDGVVAKATAAATVDRAGKTFAVFELTRAFVPNMTGTLHIPSSLLRFSWATRFQEDAIADPIPLDRQNGFVLAAARDLAVAPLPTAGKPADFGGAVGSFSITCSAAPLALAVGQTVNLELTIQGEGNLAQLQPPLLDQLPGFALQGRSERSSANARVVRYDLAVTATKVFEIPAISLPYFDPVASAYRTAVSQPIPLRIERDVAPKPTHDTPPAEPRADADAGLARYLPWAAGLLAVAAFLLWRVLRARR